LKLLLDTHVWLWSVAQPDRLGRSARKAIEAPRSEAWLSPMSVWEFFLLASRGRLRLKSSPERWITDAFARAPLRDAVLTRDVAVESRTLPDSLSDPADRFIAATARVYGLTLVTADERLMSVPGLEVLPSR
jgi:PIN domain nuclease of toxin-antitoxin system